MVTGSRRAVLRGCLDGAGTVLGGDLPKPPHVTMVIIIEPRKILVSLGY